jgi:hypothetical protein
MLMASTNETQAGVKRLSFIVTFALPTLRGDR